MNRQIAICSALSLFTLTASLVILAADHRDAPALDILRPADITDVYVFTGSPNTTVVMGAFGARAFENGPAGFGTDLIYQFNISNAPPPSQFDITAETALRITFGPSDGARKQPFTLYQATGSQAEGHMVDPANEILSGTTGQIYDLPGGGQFYAGIRDDPFFFDLEALKGTFGEEANGRTFNDGNEVDFFEGLNVLAIAFELPDSALPTQGPAGEGLNFWASTGDLASGEQVDRMGKPLINTIMNSPGTLVNATPSARDDFNATHPRDDVIFISAVDDALLALSSLDSEGPFTQAEMDDIRAHFLPDVQFFSKNDSTLPPPLNGRGLGDDVADDQLNFLSGGDPLGLFPGRDAVGGIPGDGIGPHDNYSETFPYLGPSESVLPGFWRECSLFPQQPLEAKLGPLNEGPDPTLGGFIIWNDGADNVLTGIVIPHPYDCSGITTHELARNPVLFAQGDVCTVGTTAVAPQIIDFSVGIVTVDNSGFAPEFTVSVIADTVSDAYDSADCGVTQDGVFITGHNLTDGTLEVYKDEFGFGDPSFELWQQVQGSVAGPFGGAVRDQMTTNPEGSEAAVLYQGTDGPLRVTTFDTSEDPPTFNTLTETVMTLPPPAGFTHVEESSATSQCRLGTTRRFCFTYNPDGNARMLEIPMSDPSMQITRNLGPVNNNGGTHYTFSGGAIVGQPTQTNVLWGDYSLINEIGEFAGTDGHYPNIGVGGPVDGCYMEQQDTESGQITSQGSIYLLGQFDTRLYSRTDPATGIFRGFESNDPTEIDCN